MIYASIDAVQTGKNITALQKEQGISVAVMQEAFGFANKTSIYNWKKGKSVPTSDNLVILSELFRVPVDTILARRHNNAPPEGGVLLFIVVITAIAAFFCALSLDESYMECRCW